MASSLITPSRTKRTKPTIGFVNLGCSKNQVDSEVMLGTLVAGGFQLTGDARAAEVVIINTCGFIEEAKQESINSIIEHGRLKKSGSCRVLIAAGCLAQRYQGELLKELPELDGVVGTGEFGRIAEICRSLLAPKARQQRVWLGQPPYLYDAETPRLRLGTPHSAYLKIAEGCNRNCAFCAIPIMRGKQRSRPIDSIVAEAKRLGQEGVKELNLISQDTINYGVDIGLKQGLTALLRELIKVDDVRWIRPFYLYPQQVTDELLDLYAEGPRITKYLDMPLQHISDGMLKRMHRLGDRTHVTKLVERIRTKIPGVFFRTAFIVGFPGETDAMFEELRQFVLDMEFDRVAVFLYSDEEGTSAVDLDHKVEQAVMEERRNELLALQESISESKNRQYLGRTIDVLVDGVSEESDRLLEARHEGLAPEIDGVVYCERGIAMPGDFISVTVTDVAGYDLIAQPASGMAARATSSASPTLLMPKKSGTGYR
ncbi:30S ribosomal protein S12 methylthiotransferase RimO [Nitrospira defluvii]|uniref:Ribosomal protein uS12 methylthiotransferase RimO n=1 Tax=Nitrospira defluvii TaxID=330214 RepID=A0ABM8QNI8_9BACT|nr:30S ribosomal protein S12 methylthiotransferase RimO [Nitrospira defluvii]CAE6706780.1 Ribosomal protein S12 methylthiotransferase RimO [Nitrospira defluvii]